MSTTAHFATLSPFPFCVPAWDGIVGYVGGKTLAEAMTFFWNLETFTITMAGSVTEYDSSTGATYTGSANAGFTLSPFALTGAFAGLPGYSNACAVLIQNSSGEIDPGQTSRPPRDRVCAPSFYEYPLPVVFVGVNGYYPDFQFILGICIDPSDATKYAITYRLYGRFSIDNGGPRYDEIALSESPPLDGLLASGTVAICGAVIPWYFYHMPQPTWVTVTATGLGVTATSSNFTY